MQLNEQHLMFTQLFKENEFLRARVDIDMRHSLIQEKDATKNKDIEE